MTTYRLGVDAGGTFTDFILADGEGNIRLFKASSTPEDGTKAVADGLQQISDALGMPVSEILANTELCVHGTTVALNALIEHRGVKTGLICTSGHEDSIEIRLGHKEEGHRYDGQYPPARMLVERYLRKPVRERVLADGRVYQPLNEDDVRAACEFFKREGIEAVAISFVWSVSNGAHEKRAAEIVREMMPHAYVCAGVEVYPQMREYTRTSTTIMNAYLGPVLKKYVTRIDDFFRNRGACTPVRYYQSNGGMASLDVMSRLAVNAVNSGPASAPQAAQQIGRPLGYENLITIDMGGTSFDMTLTCSGKTNITKDIDFLRYRIGTPMVQIETLGAGGGSIAWIDAMGLLNVGPQSAGAHPGPAAYMKGGTEPTVTDSNVVLGYLNPQYLLGGRLKIDHQAACDAIQEKIARPLGLTVEQAAYGVHSLVNSNMVHGIRRVTIERGHDPRDFVLVGAGGATSLHITALARDIGIRTVLVPKLASGLCAFGQILSDIKYNRMAACPMRLDEHMELAHIERRYLELEAATEALLRSEGVPKDRIDYERKIDMRYVGQVHECTVDIGKLAVGPDTIAEIRAAFDRLHEQLYTYAEPDSMVEIVNIESTVYGRNQEIAMPMIGPGGRMEDALMGRRPMVFSADGAVLDAPVYDGSKLGTDDTLIGPAVIEEPTTTIVVDPGWRISLNQSGTYILKDVAIQT